MTIPDSWKDYTPTESDRRQHAEMILHLMRDHDGALHFASRELSELYKRLCDRREWIAEDDSETYAMTFDHESGIIDRVIGAFLVVLQREIARIGELKRSADEDERSYEEVRRECSSMVKNYSAIETIYQLANTFKHDDEHAVAAANDALTRRQIHTRTVVGECTQIQIPLTYNPGELERAVVAVFGCSLARGLEPISEHVESWRVGLMAQISNRLAGG